MTYHEARTTGADDNPDPGMKRHPPPYTENTLVRQMTSGNLKRILESDGVGCVCGVVVVLPVVVVVGVRVWGGEEGGTGMR